MLEVKACRSDKEEIQRQVTAKLKTSETPQQKQALYGQFIQYLKQRSEELAGGPDNTEYKREDTIILNLINVYKLDTGGEIPLTVAPSSPAVATAALVFCTNCGQQNPATSNFCSKCGTKLAK